MLRECQNGESDVSNEELWGLQKRRVIRRRASPEGKGRNVTEAKKRALCDRIVRNGGKGLGSSEGVISG